jgi:hypothetical protein
MLKITGDDRNTLLSIEIMILAPGQRYFLFEFSETSVL